MSKIFHGTRREFNSNLAKTTLLLYLQNMLLFSQRSKALQLESNTDAEVKDSEVYDYIVIGAGAAGAVVSARLARAGFKVLVLDAGSAKKNLNYDIPAFFNSAGEDPEFAWNFFVKHFDQRSSHGNSWDEKMNGVLYPRAATLGGCTAHHAMVTMYPHLEDIKNWAQLTQDSSLADSREIYRLFNKVREWLPIEQSSPLIGLKDPQIVDNIFSALRSAGVPQSPLNQLFNYLKTSEDGILVDALDPNSQSNLSSISGESSLFLIPQASKNGHRMGPREFLLRTAANFSNLKIGTHCFVKRILLEESLASGQPKNLVAKGVEFWQQPHIYGADPHREALKTTAKKAFAKYEVILSAGAFNTPQILMHSGIGDENHLRKFGIPCRIARPGVGRNLQDRYEMTVLTEYEKNFSATQDCTFKADENDPCYVSYLKDPKSSPYSSNGILLGITKRSTARKDLASGAPDLFLFGAPGKFRGYYRGWSRKAASAKNTFSWAILKAHTKNNSGFVQLASSNPLDPPEINFKYFEESSENYNEDLEAVAEGIEYVREINKKFHPLSSERTEIFPGSMFKSREDLKHLTRRESWGHHASCTAKMGPVTDAMAVIDSKFRVHGAKNIRVVDASIFDKIPGYFIVLPIYMMAEKATEVILAEKRSPT